MNILLKVLRNRVRSNLYSGANISHRNIHLFFELLNHRVDAQFLTLNKRPYEQRVPVLKPQNCQNGTNITK